MARKGKLTQGQVDENRARIQGTLDIADFAECDLVIEAVIENMEEKLRLFPALDHVLKPDALILSNTSSLNITQQDLMASNIQLRYGSKARKFR